MVSKPNTKYYIKYTFSVEPLKDFSDKQTFGHFLSDDIVVLGVVSRFLASKGKYNESEFWNDKFMYNLFKFKVKKERQLKSNFKI